MNNINPIQHINWVDVLVFVILARLAAIGFKRGLSGELFDFTAALSAAFVGISSYERLSLWLRSRLALPSTITEVISLTALIAAVVLIWKLVELAVGSVARLEVVSQVNAFGGMALGILRGMILVSLTLLGLELTSLGYFHTSIEQRSLVGAGVRSVAPSLYQAVWRALPAKPSEVS